MIETLKFIFRCWRSLTLKLYLLTLVIFLGIDSLWLGLVAPKFYRSQIGHLMAEKANFYAAGIFYLLFVGVLVYFVVAPGFAIPTRELILRGALFGLVTYATYDLTNLATLRNWSITITIVDLLWGTVLPAATSFFSVGAAKLIGF